MKRPGLFSDAARLYKMQSDEPNKTGLTNDPTKGSQLSEPNPSKLSLFRMQSDEPKVETIKTSLMTLHLVESIKPPALLF
jgi:hypothetical protein